MKIVFRFFTNVSLFCFVFALVFAASADAAVILPRTTVDRPDDAKGASQIHVMYVLPSDGADRNFDANGTLTTSTAAFQNWLSLQTGGKKLRLDAYHGSLDITFFRLSRTDAQMQSFGAFVRDQIETELAAAGFKNRKKIYAVYYDGGSTYACGGAPWPPTLPGRVVAMYLLGTPLNATPCGNNPFAASENVPGYWEYSMIHEIFHAFGAVAMCAPNHVLSGHVSDGANDLMYAGPLAWGGSFPWDINTMRLDVNRDDYYQHGGTNCLDLVKNPYFTSSASAKKGEVMAVFSVFRAFFGELLHF